MAAETPLPPADESVDASGTRILIVDDNPQNVELLEAYLEMLGVETLVATDGMHAIEMTERERPDLILLDIMMPRMSGFEVCRKIKDDPAIRDIPIIMVTALNEVGDVERGVEAGADDFLSKPFDKKEFLERVNSRLAMSRRQRGSDHDRVEDLTNLPPLSVQAPTPEELDEETSIED